MKNTSDPTNTPCFISEYRRDLKRTWYVCAPPGYYRQMATGKMIRDGCFKGGPEWSEKRNNAFVFPSHRAAARVRNKCGDNAQIHAI